MAQLKATLDDELLDQLRALAYLEDRSVTALVADAVRGFLARHERGVDVATLLKVRSDPPPEA